MENVWQILDFFQANPFAQASAIILVSAVLAQLADWFVTRVMRHLADRTRTQADNRLIELMHKPVFYSVLLAGLATAVNILQVGFFYSRLLYGLLGTLVVVIWLRFALGATPVVLDWMEAYPERFPAVQTDTKPLFDIVGKVLVVAAASYFFLISWHVDVTAWLASAGILGLAVGFAARDTLANLFAGVFILADNPYKIGDWIVLDSGERGRVTRIGMRSTRILTMDDVEITVPNASIGNAKIVNESGGPYVKHRVRVPVGVAYGSDVDRLRTALLSVAGEAVMKSRLVDDPEPRVRFRRFGESSLDFELLCWIDDPRMRGQVVDELNTRIYKALAESGIEIPFPKRDLYIKQMPGPIEG